jgi:hypothetical protein
VVLLARADIAIVPAVHMEFLWSALEAVMTFCESPCLTDECSESSVINFVCIPHTKTTPLDESDTARHVFFQIRMNSTPPDQSDRWQSPRNPSVVGSIPTGHTSSLLTPAFEYHQD